MQYLVVFVFNANFIISFLFFSNYNVYPTSELSINTANVNAAITAQGADKLSTKIWWDKP